MSADPTLKTLADLEDATKYAKYEHVPIFRPHTRVLKNAKGEPVTITVTADDLKEIAANSKKVEEDSGTPLRISPGHIKQDPTTPEHLQPRVVGFARVEGVGTFGPGSVPALLVTKYIKRDCLADVKDYAFRSPEYYPGQKKITGVALLRRDPALDLGAVVYTGDGPCYLYAEHEGGMEMDKDKGAPPPAGSDLDPAEHEKFGKHFEAYVASHPVYKHMGAACSQYAAGAPGAAPAATPAFPGGTNVAMPEPARPALDPMALANPATAILYQQQISEARKANEEAQAALKALQAEKDALLKQNRVLSYQATFKDMEAEGYVLDVAEEVNYTQDMPVEQFNKYVERIKKHSDRAPVGAPPLAAPSARQKELSEKNLDEVLAYQRAHPTEDFERCKAAVLGGQANGQANGK